MGLWIPPASGVLMLVEETFGIHVEDEDVLPRQF
jgi:hypothetical protein